MHTERHSTIWRTMSPGPCQLCFQQKPTNPSLPPSSVRCIPHLLLPAQTYNNRNEIWLLICPPKAKHSKCWDLFVQSQAVFQTGVWVWRRDGVMRVCSFRCLFSFWLGCVRLDVSPSAHWSHYGWSDLHLIAAICWMYQGWCHGLYTGLQRHTRKCNTVIRFSDLVAW